ncbi:MAG: glutamate--tRNA ligase [Coriobacteriales bacterium]|jgi:glutamyl-tRNA synthetase|nr:glutamate--tRNA ligase [Coriobacteriales bacterium]
MTEQNQAVRVRFAPSPTGHLHIGGARTAIYNWAFARRQGGSFILRIEDTDPERSTVENTAQILRSLRWLGLDWDEGPEVGGQYGPYLQTERFEFYRQALEQLQAKGAVYPCFCSPEELEERREAALAAGKSNIGYDRSCRDLPADEVAERLKLGEPHTWRLKIPLDHGPVSFEDEVFGTTTFPIDQLDDFVLFRSDGTPTYNFVVCVDDALMQISHVIRGDDHLSNTPKQILVYEALGIQPPRFAHLSMILGGDGKRLSKRHGATSVEAFEEEGYFPQALLNYLALLGWSLDGETTLLTAQKLCENFSLERVSRNPAVFDEAKLAWINSEYIKQMGASCFINALLPYLQDYGFTRSGAVADADGVAADVAAWRPWYESIYPLVAERVKVLADVCPMIAYLFSGPKVALDEASVEKCLRTSTAHDCLAAATEALGAADLTWDCHSIEQALRLLPERLGLKPKVVFQAVRVAICGNMVSPPLFESIALLSRENTLSRLREALDLSAAGGQPLP